MSAAQIDPALNVSCPTCGANAGEPCRSQRAIRIHQARRGALRGLEAEATRTLRRGRAK
jgi:hypothetical protein